MSRRNLIFAIVAVLIVAAGAWFMFGGGGGGSGVRPGAGAYATQLADCQDRVWGDAMHIAELEFVPNTTWNQPGTDLKVGGKLTKPGARGSKTSFSYECTFRGGRLLAAQTQ